MTTGSIPYIVHSITRYFKTEIYPIISKRYNKKVNSIKASIFQSISIMYYEINRKDLSYYFGYNILNKPKPKDIIYTILDKINM